MCTPHFEIQNGVLAKCRMSGEENVTVTIPDGVTSIGKDACFDCGLLQSITIPDSVISIGDKAFAGCTALENITIPNSVINIGNYVFAECNSLQSINVSEGNSHYLSCGGVLFDKSKSVAVKFIAKRYIGIIFYRPGSKSSGLHLFALTPQNQQEVLQCQKN